MALSNNSILHDVFKKLSPIIDEIEIESISSDFVWSIILGVLPLTPEGERNKLLEISLKDTTAEKIDNIEMITHYAEYFIKWKPDYRYPNVESFSQALGQLIKYVSTDPPAEKQLDRLKDLYISFITDYYIDSIKAGRSVSAAKNASFLAEKIFTDNMEIKARLNEIIS
jgi:hypothetical protein